VLGFTTAAIQNSCGLTDLKTMYSGADKSLAPPERKQTNFSTKKKRREFPSAPCLAKIKLDDSSRLHVVEIARVTGTRPSLFPSWPG